MSLMTDYRPKYFKEVIGHEEVVKVLESKLNKPDHARVYLLSGGSGLGKTTLARIIGNTVNAQIVEFDAGNLTGVDEVRNLIKQANLPNIAGRKNKMFIIDECHMLSKSAWNSLLKTIEEPPKNTYFVFCTTELNKVPNTIKTRCLDFVLKPLSSSYIYDVLKGINVIKIDDEVLKLISRNAEGSPRAALSLLEKAIEIKDIKSFKKELKDIDNIDMDNIVLEICRELIKLEPNLSNIINNLKDYKNSYEGMRIQIFNYLTSVTLNKPDNAIKLLCFSEPVKNETTGKGEMLLKIIEAVS